MGDYIGDSQLDSTIIAFVAKTHNVTPEAVEIIIRTYDAIVTEMPDERPVPELGRRLEMDGEVAIHIFADYVFFGIPEFQGG